MLVSGTSLTKGLIQTDHNTKNVGAEKDEKKKVRNNCLCIDACMKF